MSVFDDMANDFQKFCEDADDFIRQRKEKEAE